MATFQSGITILPNWKLHYEEVSNNVYHVQLTDNLGRQTSMTDHDIENAVKTCEKYAFDLEKQVAKNWNHFLFEYARLKLGDGSISDFNYHNEVFGSWYIVGDKKRLLFDGKDEVLINQYYDQLNSSWCQYDAIAVKDLTFDKYIKFVRYVERL